VSYRSLSHRPVSSLSYHVSSHSYLIASLISSPPDHAAIFIFQPRAFGKLIFETSLKPPRGKKKTYEKKAALYEKRRIIRRTRYQDQPVQLDVNLPPLAPARREAIIRGVVSYRQAIYPQSNSKATVDEAIKEAHKIPIAVETSQDPEPAARLDSLTQFKSDQDREERVRKATNIYFEILVKQKPRRKSKRKSAAQHQSEK
jgi:hypothetical protein